jgi:hypothetical protein
VIEKQHIEMRPQDQEPDAFAAMDDATCELRIEGIEKPRTRALRIETPDALEALAHGLDAQRSE